MVSRTPTSTRKKVILVERDGLLRESLSAALAHSDDPQLVGVFENISAARKAMASLAPHVVITGVPREDESDDGAAFLRFVKDFPHVGLVILLGRGDTLPDELHEHLDPPGRRCFLKKEDITSLATLLRVVHACADGLVVINPEFLNRSVPRRHHVLPYGTNHEFRNLFSRRQQEVLDLMAQGLSNQMIANRLFVSERTVENHIYQIYHRLPDSLRAPGYHLRVTATLCYLGYELPHAR